MEFQEINLYNGGMAFKCEICGKKVGSGRSVSYSKKSVLRKFKPNLQRVRVLYKGNRRRLWICSKCLKSEDIMKLH